MKIAINGFGRIGRAFYRMVQEMPEIQVVAINDLGNRNNLEYLLRHDSVYGTFEGDSISQKGKNAAMDD